MFTKIRVSRRNTVCGVIFWALLTKIHIYNKLFWPVYAFLLLHFVIHHFFLSFLPSDKHCLWNNPEVQPAILSKSTIYVYQCSGYAKSVNHIRHVWRILKMLNSIKCLTKNSKCLAKPKKFSCTLNVPGRDGISANFYRYLQSADIRYRYLISVRSQPISDIRYFAPANIRYPIFYLIFR